MPYPVILCGDHAKFEQEWAASGKPDRERPDWPLPSFDARDWARAFCDVCIEKGFRPEQPEDEGWVIGWFANALMRGFDEQAARMRDELKFQIGLEREACAQVALCLDEDAGTAIAAGIRARNTIADR